MLHIHIRHQHTDDQHGNRAHGISGHGECRPNDCGQPDLKCKQKQTYGNRQNVHIAYQIPQGDLFFAADEDPGMGPYQNGLHDRVTGHIHDPIFTPNSDDKRNHHVGAVRVHDRGCFHCI